MKSMDLAQCVGKFLTLDMDDFVKQQWVVSWYRVNWGYVLDPKTGGDFSMKTPRVAVESYDHDGYVLVRFLDVIEVNRVQQMHIRVSAKLPIRATEFKPTADDLLEIITTGINQSGWDPEIFVTDEEDHLIPAFTFLPPKKKAIPHGRGEVYYDGFQAEFTTTPVSCHGHGFDYLRSGLRGVLAAARTVNPKAKLSTKSVFRIPGRMLQEASEEQVALGCMPSENVYNTEPYFNEACRTLPFRVSGGHIHFNINPANRKPVSKEEIENRIKAMDVFLALPCVGIFDGVDDPLRREFYGRAGEYRTPKYGLEYRTLSSAWLCDPRLGHAIMDVARRACGVGTKGDIYEILGIKPDAVKEAINFCDVRAARKLSTKIWPYFEEVMKYPWGVAKGATEVQRKGLKSHNLYKKLVFEGVGAGFPEYTSIEKNWLLDGLWGSHSNDSRYTFSHYAFYHAPK